MTFKGTFRLRWLAPVLAPLALSFTGCPEGDSDADGGTGSGSTAETGIVARPDSGGPPGADGSGMMSGDSGDPRSMDDGGMTSMDDGSMMSMDDGGTGPSDPGRPACAPVQQSGVTAFVEGPGTPSVELTFWPSGALRAVDGASCRPSSSGFTGPSFADCGDAYICSGCQVSVFAWIGSSGGSRNYGVAFQSPSTCSIGDLFSSYLFDYTCVPECQGVSCSSDGCGGNCGITCPFNRSCNNGVCECRSNCRSPSGNVCCGGAVCGGTPGDADSCLGNPCC